MATIPGEGGTAPISRLVSYMSCRPWVVEDNRPPPFDVWPSDSPLGYATATVRISLKVPFRLRRLLLGHVVSIRVS